MLAGEKNNIAIYPANNMYGLASGNPYMICSHLRLRLVGGIPAPLTNRKMMEFVSWDDDIPNLMGKS